MRQRLIKPRLLRYNAFKELSDSAKMLFLAIMVWADDSGKYPRVGLQNQNLVKGRISALLEELQKGGFIREYESEDKSYTIFQVENWGRLQTICRPSPTKYL